MTGDWRAYPVDGNPFASEAVIPEPDASIQAQHQALLDPNDPREAMLYNPGQQPIENSGLGQTRLQDGRVVQFDRQGLGALTPEKVAAYDRSNRLNELLQYGPVSKDEAVARAGAGEQPAVVTTTHNGVPVKEAAGTTATVPAQFAAQQATRGPFDRVRVTHPSSVFGRLGFQDGGGLDDDPQKDVASGATEENANERRGQAVEGDRAAQAGSGRAGAGYPEAIPGLQSGAYLGGSGGVGLGAVSDFAPAESDAFHQAISTGKAASPHGAAVTLHSPEEYAQMKPFLSSDGKSGFALNGDDIVSVFRHPEAQRGAVERALPIAVQNGGRRFDAYDPILPKIYEKGGFRAVARLPFDPQYQPADWNVERHGRPDVVFMVHDPANRSAIGGKPVATYDEGVAAQHEALKEIAARPMTAPQAEGRAPTGLMGEEEAAQRQREGFEPPGEWSGGRVGFAEGGGVELEPVEGNPFDNPRDPIGSSYDRTIQPTDVARAKGFPEPRSPMHDRIAAASQDEPQTWYGKWGKTLGDELGSVGPAIGEATDWGTEALGKFGANVIADPLPSTGLRTMSPESEANLGQMFTGAGRELLSDPMLGEGIATAPHVAEAPRPSPGQVGSDVSAAAAPARAQIMEINGVKRHIDPDFSESRVGTSVPTKSDPDAPIDAKEAAHANNNMHVGMELAATVPTYGRSIADRVRNDRIPYVKTAQGADDAAVQESLIEHMKDNLLGLYNRVSGAVRSGSKLWYEGAHTRARDIALTHDIPHENAAGVVASMSPQKDWDQNVTLADWVAHTAGTTAHDATMSPEMIDWVNRYALRKDPERVVTNPETGKETRFNARTGEEMSPLSVSREDVELQLAQARGKTWGQMTPDQKAFYTRAYYEAHGPPSHLMPIDDRTGAPAHWIDDKGDRKYGYYINNPNGTHDGVLARYSDEYPNKKDQPIPVSWGSAGEVANAIQAFGAKSMSDISEALGSGHKVRSFYNNIIAPWSKKGDVTSDTHAVAAALLRPLGASSPEAASGMGAASPNNAETGLNGFYPHVAEAYRRAAKKAGILPRELQSITWEALRGLWSPREKMAKSNVKKNFTSPTDATNAIWQRYKNGEISLEDAHNAILGPNGERISPPRWFETFKP